MLDEAGGLGKAHSIFNLTSRKKHSSLNRDLLQGESHTSTAMLYKNDLSFDQAKNLSS